MSYTLEFPPNKLPVPQRLKGPPFVRIKIGLDVDVTPWISDKKSPRIPLQVILHFAPELEVFLEAPTPKLAGAGHDVHTLILPPQAKPEAVAVIINRMMQAAGLPVDKIHTLPRRTDQMFHVFFIWCVMGMPPSGAASLRRQIISNFWFRKVTKEVMWDIWCLYKDEDDEIVTEMCKSIVRTRRIFEDGPEGYTPDEFARLQAWAYQDEDLVRKIMSIQEQVIQECLSLQEENRKWEEMERSAPSRKERRRRSSSKPRASAIKSSGEPSASSFRSKVGLEPSPLKVNIRHRTSTSTRPPQTPTSSNTSRAATAAFTSRRGPIVLPRRTRSVLEELTAIDDALKREETWRKTASARLTAQETRDIPVLLRMDNDELEAEMRAKGKAPARVRRQSRRRTAESEEEIKDILGGLKI